MSDTGSTKVEAKGTPGKGDWKVLVNGKVAKGDGGKPLENLWESTAKKIATVLAREA